MGLFPNILKWLRDKTKDEYSAPDAEAENSEPREPSSEESSSEVMPAVFYDKYLFERARTQWQFGDWESLAQMDRQSLYHHPQRARLALLAAAGHQQRGNMETTREFTRLAKEWGASKKMISQVLIAGVYNTLGKASALCGQQQRALGHFQVSLRTAGDGGDVWLLMQARAGWNMNFRYRSSRNKVTPLDPSLMSVKSFQPKIIADHCLGDAWAGNTINTVIFRHHGILTYEKNQYTAFYVDENTLRLAQRDLATDKLKTYDLPGEYNLKDAHNSISLGIDRQGHLHISYDHHATQLCYRRSLKSGDISAWSDELPMTGAFEEKVTYPTFILPRHRFPLTLLYRDGVHDKGTARLKTYDETTQTWADHPQPILNGSKQKPWTSNAYWNHPAIGSDGSLHLSFVWRTHTLGEEQRINNVNIGYACSHDNGLTWETSQKRPYKLPITQVNAETIHPVSPGSNLINQSSMALDSRNRPHIVFYADDPDGIPQYQSLWFDGKVWRHQYVSNRKQTFCLQGGGTLQIPISRPEIVIDHSDNVYIITRGDHTQGRMAASLLIAPDYRCQPNNIQVLDQQDLCFAEPVIDRERWQQENVLSMLLQCNEQPDHDIGHRFVQAQIRLVDLQFGEGR